MNGSSHIFENIDALYSALEEHWRSVALAAIADHGSFHVALAGGGTPKNFYTRLASSSAIDNECWKQTHVWFGDERCVPQNHADSNFRMASEALLNQVPVQAGHVHAMYSAEFSAKENAEKYSDALLSCLPKNASGLPVFDLVLLGMGDDGHTASLFPDTDILNEIERPVAAQFVTKLDAWRVSLTFPVINAAAHVAILVAGEAKAQILSSLSSASKKDELRYPIQRVNPDGCLDWYLDVDAVRLLNDQG